MSMFGLFCSVPVCAVSCCSSADWQRKVLEFNLLRASIFSFFCGASYEWHNGGQVSILSQQKVLYWWSDAWWWVRPLTECNYRSKIAASKLGIYHSYQYKQSLKCRSSTQSHLELNILDFLQGNKPSVWRFTETAESDVFSPKSNTVVPFWLY